MHTAVFASRDATKSGGLRSHLLMSGRTVLSWQVELARLAGCERILCIADRKSGAIEDAKEQAHTAGIEFQTVSGPLALTGLITADQDVLVLMDGLIVDLNCALEFLGDGRGIASLEDSEQAYASDFERIDARRRWAGLMRLRGSTVSKLVDLPSDADAVSSLLRLALQSGVPVRSIDLEVFENSDWLLAKGAQQLRARDEKLVSRALKETSWHAPFEKLAGLAAARLATKSSPLTPAFVLASGLLLLAGAIALSWFDYSLYGIGAAIFGCFAITVGHFLKSIRQRVFGELQGLKKAFVISIIRDVLLILCLVFPYPNLESVLTTGSLLMALRVAENLNGNGRFSIWKDRVFTLVILAIFSVFGQIEVGVAAILTLTLAFAFYRSTRL